MTLVEFIGFIISFIAVVFLFIKNFKETRHRLKYPEDLEDSFEDERHEYYEEERQRSSSKFAHMPPPAPVLRKEAPQRKKTPSPYFKADHDDSGLTYHKYKGKDEAHYEDRILSKQFKELSDNTNDYHVTGIKNDSRGANYIKNMKSRKEMLVMKEIFDKPLSLRNPDDSFL